MTERFFTHVDQLADVCHNDSIEKKLRFIHQDILSDHPIIDRIAIALYNAQTDLLHTFIASCVDDNPLVYYDAHLSDSPSLFRIKTLNQPRVVNDMGVFNGGSNLHTRMLEAKGYRASYTVPIYHRDKFHGFLFVNSYQKGAFTDELLDMLDIYIHLIITQLMIGLDEINAMIHSLHTAIRMVKEHDPETGGHLDRLSHYSRVIALELARSGKYQFSDEWIEYLFLFAPLHDLGKIAIPDNVLVKPGRLTDEEWQIMQTHAQKGGELVETILLDFQRLPKEYLDMAVNIPHSHHERVDGQGYYRGLKGIDIPIEARIVSVADVFDALTTQRPYKPAWPIDRALREIKRMRGVKLDDDCLDAFLARFDEIEQIRRLFTDRSDN